MKENLTTETICEEPAIDPGNKDLIENMIHRWGGPISEAIFDSPCHFFHDQDIEGFIGYRLIADCAVIYGDPVCPFEDKGKLAESFQKFCNEKKINVIYISASEKFAKWAISHTSKVSIEVGEEIAFDPFIDPKEGPKAARLRNRINHALSLGLSVHEYLEHDESIEKSIQNVGVAWLKGRRGPQIHLGEINFFANRNAKRWFYVKDKDQDFIGMALLSRLEAYQGWLLKFLIIVPEAPRGTSELLLTSILEVLHKEECHFMTYGMVPAEDLGEIKGLSKFSAWVCRVVFKMARWLFHLEQRKLYWEKFRPNTEKSYLLFSNPHIGFKEIKALMNALKVS